MPLQYPAPVTPFQASLLPASFRGVPFAVTDERGAIGRRGKLHEYPFRDIPYAEDLGRRARRWVVDAFVLGDDAVPQRDALIAACEQKGPGPLIINSAFVGNVQIDPETPIEWNLRLDAGRSVELRLVFVESGQVLYPTSDADTQAATGNAADDARAALAGDASSRMSVLSGGTAGSLGIASGAGKDAVLSDANTQLGTLDAQLTAASQAYQAAGP